MAWFMGIDIGSGMSKGVIVQDGNPATYHMLASGVNYKAASLKLRGELLAKAGLDAEAISRTVTTGRGANLIPFSSKYVADLQCCAKGINSIFPEARMVIDVQGQSIQAIRLEEGRVINFAVSESCAGSSGSFIEVIANVLQINLEEIGPISLKSEKPVTFTTGCAVFGESEAVSRIAEGISVEDILAGVHKSIADKISSLIARIGLEEPCAISGGGGLNIGIVKKVEDHGIKLLVPDYPQFINALGAAVMAKETVN
jgi:(R)-2-hydroxyacyl-CoA dehydratese activating ATPase